MQNMEAVLCNKHCLSFLFLEKKEEVGEWFDLVTEIPKIVKYSKSAGKLEIWTMLG